MGEIHSWKGFWKTVLRKSRKTLKKKKPPGNNQLYNVREVKTAWHLGLTLTWWAPQAGACSRSQTWSHTHTLTHTRSVSFSSVCADRLSGVHLLTYPLMNPQIIRIMIFHNYIMVCVGRIPLNPLQPCKTDHSEVRHVLSLLSLCLCVSAQIRWEKNITLGEPPGFLHSWWWWVF